MRVLPPLPKTVIWPPSWREQGIAPFQAADLADADAGDVQQFQQDPIAAFRGGLDQPGHFALFEDALRQGVAIGPEFDGGADVEWQISGFLGKGEQALDGGERPVLAGGLETSLPQMLGPGLEIRERDPGERFLDEGQEAGSVGGIGAPGMPAGLHGKPEFDQFGDPGSRHGRVRGRKEAPRRAGSWELE